MKHLKIVNMLLMFICLVMMDLLKLNNIKITCPSTRQV